MAQPSTSSKKHNEKKLVFEKVKYDPLSNPAVFGIGGDTGGASLNESINIDSGWDSEEKKEPSPKTNIQQSIDHTKDTNIEANIERAKKKKKVDFRAEMTSDSQDIEDLLIFQTKQKNEKEEIKQIDQELLNVGDDDLLKIEKNNGNKKSLEDLLAETDIDQMFKAQQDKENDTDKLDINVDDNFNFEQYINQQNVGKTDD